MTAAERDELAESRVDLLAAAMYGFSRAEAEKLIDDFTHALAEKIRACSVGDAEPWIAPTAAAAADLIDPKEQQ